MIFIAILMNIDSLTSHISIGNPINGNIYIYILVGGFKHFLFSIIYGIILPIDSYVSEGLKPPTSIYIYIPSGYLLHSY